MKKAFAIALALFTLQGCATSYQSSGFTGGYSETQLDENVFKVSFRGNGYTGMERATNFTLLRSAELTLEHGYNYFAIIGEHTYTTTTTHTAPVTVDTTVNTYGDYSYGTSTVSGGGTTTWVKPGTTNTIVCFGEKPNDIFSYNAEFVYKSITEKYGIKK